VSASAGGVVFLVQRRADAISAWLTLPGVGMYVVVMWKVTKPAFARLVAFFAGVIMPKDKSIRPCPRD
jgi:hypothetical protein